jgi:enoyl-CoA hydratase
MENQSSLLVERKENGVVLIYLHNPPLNLITLEMTRQVSDLLKQIDTDDSVRVVVITGSGDRAFCAGADIKEFMDVRGEVAGKKLAKENKAWSQIEFLSKPVIAVLEGTTCGGGCEIAMACDLRIMSDNSKIGLPEINLGVFPGVGGLFRLPKLVGMAKALELLYTGQLIDAGEALRIGLVNQVVPRGQALTDALSLADHIASKSSLAISVIKRGVRESQALSHQDAVQLSLDLSDIVFKSDDCIEGVQAFKEKRKPEFNKTR